MFASVAVLDNFFQVLLERQTGLVVADELKLYMDGVLPERFPKPWASVDRILLPWNLKNEH